MKKIRPFLIASLLFCNLIVFGKSPGNQTTETTELPVLTTNYPTDVTMTSATLGGNVTSEGSGSVTERGIVWSTDANPTVSDNKTNDGTGSGEFISYLDALESNTKYYVRAYATNILGTAYGNEVIVKTQYGTVTDIDGNIYGTVEIGDQVWMAENLRVTHENDGSPIFPGGYCWYNNDEETYKNPYGALYSCNRRNLCPVGWHLPYDTEWSKLYNYLGDNHGGKLKEAGTEHWNSPNTGATNETGFSALPGGFMYPDGTFSKINEGGYFWSRRGQNEYEIEYAEVLSTADSSHSILGFVDKYTYEAMKSSLRCVYGKDTLPDIKIRSISEITTNSAIYEIEVGLDGSGSLWEFGLVYSTSPIDSNINLPIGVYLDLIFNDDGTANNDRGIHFGDLEDLQSDTIYYVRAYARNEKGISYGEEISFETKPLALPQLTTNYPKDVDMTSATLGGNITSDGGATVTERGIVWSTNPNPTVSDNKTNDGTGAGEFASNLEGLESNTKYYVRAYATNILGTAYGNEVIVKTQYGTVTDIDGNTYGTVKIGEQIWMAENLRVTHFNDGDSIEGNSWPVSMNPEPPASYCWYNNDTSYKDPYGAFYNQYAVSTRKLCPSNWHVSTGREWEYLIKYLGGAGVAGGKLKEAGTGHWQSPNNNATNEFGFNALPAGWIHEGGQSMELGEYTYWWAPEEGFRLSYRIHYSSGVIITNDRDKYYFIPSGHTIRCVYGGDSSDPILPELKTNEATFVSDKSAILGGSIVHEGGVLLSGYGVVWSTNHNPTIDDNIVGNYGNSADFKSDIVGLEANTTYYVRAYATNSAGTSYGEEVSFKTGEPVIDIDGNSYGTVKIGDQVWMSENLGVKHLNDGTNIPLIESNTAWSSADSPGYCWYNNDEATYKIPYGAIYNTYTVNTKQICPTGWQVPSDNDWLELADFLGGVDVAGGILKESGTTHWIHPNKFTRYKIGFVGLPGGYRTFYDGSFMDIGFDGNWWSSDKVSDEFQSYWYVKYGNGNLTNNSYNSTGGLSIRCIKIETPNYTIPELTSNYPKDIDMTSATLGGNITSDGGATVTERGVVWSTNQNPTVSDNKTNDGTGSGEFTSNLEGLESNTKYYVRAYATNSVGTAYGNEVIVKTHYGTVTDIDGNTYGTVKIGEQIWMAENLQVTKFSDGTSIHLGDDEASWPPIYGNDDEYLDTAAYCWHNNDISYKDPYGAFYNKYAVNKGNLCPSGWHIPESFEWGYLINFLGGNDVAGGKLKEAGTEHWRDSNTGATNEVGFRALPAGMVEVGANTPLGKHAYWWGFSNSGGGFLSSSNSSANLDIPDKVPFYRSGYPVRCVYGGDLSEPIVPTVKTNRAIFIMENSAVIEGQIVNRGGAPLTSSGIVWSTSPNPTVEDNQGGFIITGLEPNTKYYARAYATNVAGTGYGEEISFVTTSSLVDIDDNIYPTVKVGSQIWMAENLRAKHLNDGTDISLIESYTDWSSANSPGYCWYNNDESTYNIPYGAIYNTFTVNTQKVCPYGWKVPNDDDWSILVEFFGGEDVAGGYLKEDGLAHWNWPNREAKYYTGFVGLPGGYRAYYDGSFTDIGENGNWWSSDKISEEYQSYWYVISQNGYLENYEYNATGGLSIRCIQKECYINFDLGEPIISCTGETVTLDAGSGYDSYLWSTSATTQTLDVTEGGVYSVTVTQGSCEASDEIEVTFNDIPEIELGEPITSCTGETVTLDAGSGYDSYLWSTGATTQTIDVTETGVYSLTVTQGSCEALDEIDVTFNDVPEIELGEPITSCTGETVILDAGSGFDSYMWSTGATTQAIDVAETGVYSVTVTQGSCEASDDLEVTFNDLPDIELGEPITSCTGEPVTLDAGSGFDSYLWSTGATTQSIDVTETGVYSVTITQGSCEASDELEVTFNDLPDIELGKPITSCTGEAVELNSGTGFDSYSWSTGATTQTIQVTDAGVYSVSVSLGSCNTEDEISVTFNPLPIITLGNDTTIFTTDVLGLTPGSGFVSYLWNEGSTAEAITIENETEGIHEYSVIVKDANGCEGSDTIIVTVNLANSITDYLNSGLIKIYPNPTSDKIYLKSEKPINQKINIAVFDLSGRKMISKEYNQFDFNYEYEIDLSDLSEGTYMMHVSDDTDVEVFSIMKHP